MKNLRFIFIALLLFSVSSVFSAENAFDRGSKSLSGGFSYTRLSGDAYYDTDIVDFTPSLTFAISRGTFIGGIVQIRYISQEGYYGSNYSDTQWQLGGVFEKYFVQSRNFQNGMVPFFKIITLFSKDDGVTQLSGGVQVGVLKMLSNSVGLDIGIKGIVDRFSAGSNSITGFQMEAGVGVKTFIF